jgi:hypothetical protein
MVHCLRLIWLVSYLVIIYVQLCFVHVSMILTGVWIESGVSRVALQATLRKNP